MCGKNDVMKKSFVLHKDSLSVLDELTNEQAGILFKAIRNYQNGEPVDLEFGLRMAFIPFENQFERDNEAYENTVKRNRDNGSKGGRPKKPTETQKTHSVIEEPKKPDSVSDSDNVSDSEESFNLFWSKYPKKVSKGKCQTKFTKLPQKDIDNILNNLDRYIAYKPFAEYNHPNPMTFLNQRRWEDELPTIIDNTKPNPNQMISSPEDVKNLFES